MKRMFEVLFQILFINYLMLLISFASCYFYTTNLDKKFNPLKYYKYEEKTLWYHFQLVDNLVTLNECIEVCQNHADCFAVTYHQIYSHCYLYPRDIAAVNTLHESNGGDTYTRLIPASYCKKYKNVCGECKCIDQMDTKIPYQCDCYAVAGTRDNCDDHRLAGFSTSGVYSIDLYNSTELRVFCKMDSKGKAYMLIMRRSDGVPYGLKERHVYINNFGDFQSNYWYGMQNLYNITNNFNMKLIIEYVDRSYKKHEVVLENFKIGNLASNYKVTTTSWNALGTTFHRCHQYITETYYTTECKNVETTANPAPTTCTNVEKTRQVLHSYGWWWWCWNHYQIPTDELRVWWRGIHLYNFKMYLAAH